MVFASFVGRAIARHTLPQNLGGSINRPTINRYREREKHPRRSKTLMEVHSEIRNGPEH